MSREGGRRADLSEVVQSRGGTTTLVLGATSHDAACHRLAGAGTGHAYRVRVTADGSADAPHASTDGQYETGVYDGLAVPEAGVAVTDTVANLGHDGGGLDSGGLVVCVDGLPAPSERAGRRELFQFLDALTRRVTDVDGHCHAHVPADADSRVAAVLAPLFDYVVDAQDVDAPDA